MSVVEQAGLNLALTKILKAGFLTSRPISGKLLPCQRRLLSSADNLCKQFCSKSGMTERLSLSGSKSFDTLLVFLDLNVLKKIILKKVSRRQKIHEKMMESVNFVSVIRFLYCLI